MTKILTCSQMKSADNWTINTLKISSEELCLRAGNAIYEQIVQNFNKGSVLICIGIGNNGADGEVVYELLCKNSSFSVDKLYAKDFVIPDKAYDIIIDCIFGIGLNRNVEGNYKKCIDYINNCNSIVVSCDIPSGLNGDNGLKMGTCVCADYTYAIQHLKLGHYLNDGVDNCGIISVLDIGIVANESDYAEVVDYSIVNGLFEKRKRNVNKGNFGKACIIGGSMDFPGSVILSCNALTALKMGVGYSNLCIPKSLLPVYASINPECTITCLNDDNGRVVFDKQIIDKLLNYDCIAIGMGIGVSEEVYKIISYLLKSYKGKLVIDADGLNTLSKYGVDVLRDATCSIVLTPHVVEFSRLIGREKGEILYNGVALVKEFSKKYNVITILKNATSIITDGNLLRINVTGCSGMAKGGSGDVLSGIICGLLARSINNFDCVCASSYLFGLCGEVAQKNSNEYCMTATDVVKEIPNVVNSFLN